MPCKRDRYDIKRIETVANSALLILGVSHSNIGKKMKVFISWSGISSKEIALALRGWIPDVIQSVTPWMSEADLDAGTRWSREVERELSETKFGIIVVTRDSVNSPWILFEAGALAKTIPGTFVCPYLIDLSPTDIPPGPLNQFQAKMADQNGTWDLICTINKALKDISLPKEKIERTFKKWWPDLEASIKNRSTESATEKTIRSTNEISEEILEHVRMLVRKNRSASDIDVIFKDISAMKSSFFSSMEEFKMMTNNLKQIRNDLYGKWVPENVTIELLVPMKTGKIQTRQFKIQASQSISSALNMIFDVLILETELSFPLQAYTYLWNWILVRKNDNRPLFIKGFMHNVPAYTVFENGDQWEVVPLDEPLLNKPERIGFKKGNSDMW